MPDFKPIETIYRGYRFRSRLEARWAVFFDALGIPWEYEKEGYELDDMLYLPDFWLPDQDCWVEIKGTNSAPSPVGELAQASGKDVYVFHGPILLPEEFEAHKSIVYYGGGSDHAQYWCECPDCGSLGIHYSGFSDRLSCKQCSYCFVIEHRINHLTRQEGCWKCTQIEREWDKDTCPKHGNTLDKGCPPHSLKLTKYPNYKTPRLIAAYTAARQVRFEHGERPG